MLLDVLPAQCIDKMKKNRRWNFLKESIDILLVPIVPVVNFDINVNSMHSDNQLLFNLFNFITLV